MLSLPMQKKFPRNWMCITQKCQWSVRASYYYLSLGLQNVLQNIKNEDANKIPVCWNLAAKPYGKKTCFHSNYSHSLR